MSDTWNDMQPIKYQQNVLNGAFKFKMDRDSKPTKSALTYHLQLAKQEDDVSEVSDNGCTQSFVTSAVPLSEQQGTSGISTTGTIIDIDPTRHHQHVKEMVEKMSALEIERKLLMVLHDVSLHIPSHSKVIAEHTSRLIEQEVDVLLVEELLRKFAAQKLISIVFNEDMGGLFVTSLNFTKLSVYSQDLTRQWRDGSEGESKNMHSKTVANSDSGDLENSSNMAANLAEVIQPHLNSGPIQQPLVPAWFCGYETNSSLNSAHPGHRQELNSGPYYSVTVPHTSSNVSLEPYVHAPIRDTSHMSGQLFPSNAAPQRINTHELYQDVSAGNTPVGELNRTSSMNPENNMSARTLCTPRNPSSRTGGNMPVIQACNVSGDARDGQARHYIPVSGTDIHVPLPPHVLEMPASSAFTYPSVPYTLTVPPSVAAPAVTASSFTHVNNIPSFEMAGPITSYPWSATGDLIPSAKSSTKRKSSSKTVKIKNGTGGKKRCKRPEMWKKNVTKSKKLKGEEHISRNGNVIPAKQVEEVDCSSCSFKCHENFSEDLRRELFEVFYSLCSNESQKQFVCQNVQESATKTANTNKIDGPAENKRKVCRKYFLPDTDNTRKQVCSKFFCATLAVGKTFITHALRNKQFGCYVGKEKRGKPHNKIPDMLLEPARQHISTLLASSSSGSKRASKKKCLERGLNITKMYEMFQQECAMNSATSISLSMYRRIFHTEF